MDNVVNLGPFLFTSWPSARPVQTAPGIMHDELSGKFFEGNPFLKTTGGCAEGNEWPAARILGRRQKTLRSLFEMCNE